MDLDGCKLDYAQKMALRSLNYGPAVKVGIKFKTRWWQDPSFQEQGGLSLTDRQSRTLVYPSYRTEGPADVPGVVIATYNWNQDAFRYGSLVERKDWNQASNLDTRTTIPAWEDFLLTQIFNDLARFHGRTPLWYRNEMLDYYAFNWYHNPYTFGAYAHFGPGQFSDFYTSITKPASDGMLHFGGEVASSHHGWISGALDSAYRCVWEIVAKDGTDTQKDKFKQKYGGSKEIDDVKTSLLQYYRGLFANSLENPKGNKGKFPAYSF